MRLLFTPLFYILLNLYHNTESWFFWPSKIEAQLDEAETMSEKTNNFRQVGFEMLTQDERMQKELAAIEEMSPMGSCYYMVLEELKVSCGALSEEEMGKLSVQLLNCQSKVEGRTLYKCTNSMTIGECTEKMDPTVWNSYQIVSNRARAICYQVRQQQFRIKTELTVDKLVQSSEYQLRNFKEMQDRQTAIKSLTDEAILSLTEGQDRLSLKQRGLESLQSSIETKMDESLDKLEQQKTMTVEGTQLLTRMTEQLQDKLDTVANHIEAKDAEMEASQQHLLTDLNILLSTAEAVNEKLAETQAALEKEGNVSRNQHLDLLSSLSRINETAVYVAEVLQDVKSSLQGQLDWLNALVSAAGADISDIKKMSIHLVYILLVMLLLSFVSASAEVRWLTIFASISNCILSLKTEFALDLPFLTLLICCVCLGQLCLSITIKKMGCLRRKKDAIIKDIVPSKSLFMHSALSTPDIRKVIKVLETYQNERKDSCNLGNICEESSPFYPPQTPPPPSPSIEYDNLIAKHGHYSAKRSLLRNFDDGLLRERCHKSVSPSRSRHHFQANAERLNRSSFKKEFPVRTRANSPARVNQETPKDQSKSITRNLRSKSPSRINSAVKKLKDNTEEKTIL